MAEKKVKLTKRQETFKQKFYDGLEHEGGDRNENKYTKLYKPDIRKIDKTLLDELSDGKCCCGHSISDKKYVQHIGTNKIVEIGNCCIKRFGVERICEDCGQEHRNMKNNVCSPCRKAREQKAEEDKKKRQKAALEAQIKAAIQLKNEPLEQYEPDDNQYRKQIIDTKAKQGPITMVNDIKFKITPQAFGNTILKFGKYKGETWEYVFKNNLQYAEWYASQPNCPIKDKLIEYYRWISQ